jgi:hypothetical protein
MRISIDQENKEETKISIIKIEKNTENSKDLSTPGNSKEKLSGPEFRVESKSKSKNKSDRKINPPEGKEACHKIPNSILKDAHNNTTCKNVKKDLLDFAYSKDNIIYSENNDKHSEMERDLEKETYHQSSVNQKGGSFVKALENLHEKESSASTHVMKEALKNGPGYVDIVSKMDKRTFNSPSEKKVIDKARKIMSGEIPSPKKTPTKSSTVKPSLGTPSTPKMNTTPTVKSTPTVYTTPSSSSSSYSQSYSSYGSSSSGSSSSGGTFYKGGQFTPGGGRAPPGGCYK